VTDEQKNEETEPERPEVQGTTYRDAEGVEISAEAVAMGALEPDTAGVPRSFVVPDAEGYDASAYLGTSPEYQTYAHPTHQPLLNEEERFLYTPPTAEELAEMESENDKDGDGEDDRNEGDASQQSTEEANPANPATTPEERTAEHSETPSTRPAL
jgi:hypothetical protein